MGLSSASQFGRNPGLGIALSAEISENPKNHKSGTDLSFSSSAFGRVYTKRGLWCNLSVITGEIIPIYMFV